MTQQAASQPALPQQFREVTDALFASMSRVIDGKPEAVRSAIVCLLAEGHLLLEDVPGVGKTMLARALAASISASVRRIQFTPDLLPGDVTGISIYDQRAADFEFKPGAVFANIVIADEINRASPKTQSALLEAMEERQVSVDGRTHPLPHPFVVVATQNPLDMEGTYALPEAQRDRFLMRLSIGYPDAEAERAMLRGRSLSNPLSSITPVTDVAEIAGMIRITRGVFTSPLIEAYVVALSQATRSHPQLRLGASPRASLQLIRAAKAWAALAGRAYVIPDDVMALIEPVFAHRLLPVRPSAGMTEHQVVLDVLRSIIATVPVPVAVS